MVICRPIDLDVKSSLTNGNQRAFKDSMLSQHHLLSLLLKHPTRHQAIQIHSHLFTNGCGFGFPSWKIIFNTLLRIYSQGLFPDEALKLYKHHNFSSHPDSFTYSFLFKACTNLHQPIKGTQLHAQTIKVGFESHVYVRTYLVNMYLVCGCLTEGTKVFDELSERNLVTWNAIITGLTKWGELDFARKLFEEMPCRNVISWTGIIDGYTRMNQHKEALTLFHRMMTIDSLKPSEITILTVLPAVWNLGDLCLGQLIHAYIEKIGFNAADIRVSNTLIDVYAKCGCIDSAFKAFDEVSATRKNLVTWTSIISGFSMHGMAKEALEQFEDMEKEGLRPNRVTFLCLFNACSHGGLVQEGLMFFTKMVVEYQITPVIKHYGCIVDMLGRAGMLEEAEKIAMDIAMEVVNVVIWRTLLGSWSFHGNIKMGERVTKKIFEMEKRFSLHSPLQQLEFLSQAPLHQIPVKPRVLLLPYLESLIESRR